MREIPALFNGPMVRAILAGDKTQTRRPLYVLRNVSPACKFDRRYLPPGALPPFGKCWTLSPWANVQPGDRLWVRETWAPLTAGYAYSADPVWNQSPSGKWRPSIHMPRAACRTLLDITAVRVERLQVISEADAYAEGIEHTEFIEDAERQEPATGYPAGKLAFRALWQSAYDPDSWDDNPWVIVTDFKRTAEPGKAIEHVREDVAC